MNASTTEVIANTASTTAQIIVNIWPLIGWVIAVNVALIVILIVATLFTNSVKGVLKGRL